jgi:hypothetical protein
VTGDGEAERLRRSEVDNELDLQGRVDWKIAGLGFLKAGKALKNYRTLYGSGGTVSVALRFTRADAAPARAFVRWA